MKSEALDMQLIKSDTAKYKEEIDRNYVRKPWNLTINYHLFAISTVFHCYATSYCSTFQNGCCCQPMNVVKISQSHRTTWSDPGLGLPPVDTEEPFDKRD